MIDCSKEYGLVLAGGGAKGAFQIGAWKAINECGIHIKGVVGTSVGALNGAMFVQKDYKKAVDFWKNITYSKVFNVDDKEFEKLLYRHFNEIKYEDLLQRVRKITYDKGLDISPLKKIIKKYIREDELRQSGIDFGLVTYSLSDMKAVSVFLEDIEKGQVNNYLLASSYLPIFKQEKLNGKYYLDGGFHSLTPTELLVDKGYKNIIIVKIEGVGIERRVRKKGLNLCIIEPSEDLGSMVEFNMDKARYNMKLGYLDAMRCLKKLDGTKYYIQCKKNEKYFANRLLRLSKKSMRKFLRGVGNMDYPVERYFYEQGLPYLAKKMKLNNNWTYKELIISLLEVVAENIGLEQKKIYTYETFVSNVQHSIQAYRKAISLNKRTLEFYGVISEILMSL